MTEIIGVRFRQVGKVYYFDPAGITASAGSMVLVETVRGVELGECTIGNKMVEDKEIVSPLKKLVRIATPEDIATMEKNAVLEKEAFAIAEQKIQKHKLDMKLVDVEYTFDGSKILFYFTADGRIDFRELVKDLASVFRTRIDLRQIGVRDEAKMLGGLGICGRPLCCTTFLEDFQPVSIKMAKEQSLSLNPVKISGICGRLMCCLKYEQEAYEELVKITPRIDSVVSTPSGEGVVTSVNLLRGTVTVKFDGQGEVGFKTFKRQEVKTVRLPSRKDEDKGQENSADARPENGEQDANGRGNGHNHNNSGGKNGGNGRNQRRKPSQQNG